MTIKSRWWWVTLNLAGMLVLLTACGGLPRQDAQGDTPEPTAVPQSDTPEPTTVPQGGEPYPTPTYTPAPGGDAWATPSTSVPSPCEGLGGEVEVQVVVGPAEAVGLEPVAVGSVPFSVVTGEAPFLLEGGGDISYADILTEKWGTYEVTLDLATVASGECVAGAEGGELNMTLSMTGDQMVVVTAEGFSGEYPWAGAHEFQVWFPLEEGATATGEGWVFVLHLGGG